MAECPHCGDDPLGSNYGPIETRLTDIGEEIEAMVDFRCGSCDGPLSFYASAPVEFLEER